MADGARPLLGGRGTPAQLGVVVEVEGGVSGWDAVGPHHAGPGQVKLRQIGWAHWKQNTHSLLFWGLDDENCRLMESANVIPIFMETLSLKGAPI